MVGLRLSKEYITLLDIIKNQRKAPRYYQETKKGYLILSRKKERLLELILCYDAAVAVLKVIEVEVDLGPIEDEDVTVTTDYCCF